MVAGTFKVTAKTPRYRRNTTKLSSPATLFALAVLAAMLFSVPLLFINISRDGTGADSLHSPANVFSSQPIPVVASPSEGAPSTNTTAKVRETYGQMPMSFEANRGQADQSVNFVARGAGYTLALSPTAAAFGLRKADCGLRNEEAARQIFKTGDRRGRSETNLHSAICNPQSAVLRMNLVGANAAATVAGQNELEGKVNYFIGNDPAQWRTNIPTFGRVRYNEVYEGIDVVYYGNQKQLEYDFVVAPGRAVDSIALKFAGAKNVEVETATGDLLVQVGEHTIRQHKPFTYQETEGGRREIESRYELKEDGQVGFEVREYDASAPLVIDPVLQYSTYLGGSGDDVSSGIAVDSAGNAYITGRTSSTNFPTVNPIQGTLGGSDDVFVTKINPDGSGLIYSTYLGGSSSDLGFDIAVDSAGNAYVTGTTFSSNFPTASAFQGTIYEEFSLDAFIFKLNPAGAALIYSTYLGGESHDAGHAIAVDSAGNAYVTGFTDAPNFPIANPSDGTRGGPTDAFVTKINAAGSALVYSTYLGGSASEQGHGIAVDSLGRAFVTGETTSTNFPVSFSIPNQNFLKGGRDAFVTMFQSSGSRSYSTYLGGNGVDVGGDVALDSAGEPYITGRTTSTLFPTVNPIQGTLGGLDDAFVTKIDLGPNGLSIAYSTYLGGNSVDGGGEIALDSAGNAYVTGATSSPNFPTVNPIQGTLGGEYDAFVTKINAAGSALVYSTYLGGCGNDSANAIAVDSQANAYLTGLTPSSCFPTTSGAFDTTYNGGNSDAFISKISETAAPSTLTACPIYQFSQSNFAVSESAGFVNVNVTRTGETSSAGTIDYATSDNSNVIPDEAQAVALCGTVNGVALSKCDFNTAVGTLRFAPGETTKSFTVLLTQDSYVEGTERAPLTLSNPINGTILCGQNTAILEITDDPVEPSTNAIDDPRNFVRQHYHDFLNREPDQAGWDFWTDNIAKCNDPARRPSGQTVEQCLDKQRETTSGAFFVSPEFQYTGSYIYGVYKGSLGRRPTFLEFMRDLPQLVNGIIVGGAISGPAIEANRAQYLAQFVQRAEFASIYGALSNQGYVDKLFMTTGTSVSDADKQALVNGLDGGTETRSSVLHKMVNGTRVISEGQVEIIAVYGKTFSDTEFNPSFVQMEYFGYMRRNEDTAGFNFWLGKMNFYGDFLKAEMVRSFLLSPEYRRRFGSP